MLPSQLSLSTKGQVVIPKKVRDALNWKAGTDLILVMTSNGVILQAAPKKTGDNLAKLRGFLNYEGEPVELETLCEPVDYERDWQKKEQNKT